MYITNLTVTSSVVKCFPALSVCELSDSDYGKQRLFGMVGMAAISPLAGLLMDVYSSYAPAYLVADVLLLLSLLVIPHINVKISKPKREGFFGNVWRIVRNTEILLFLLIMLVLGSFDGFLQYYLYMFLDDLGSPRYLLGMSISVSKFWKVPLQI